MNDTEQQVFTDAEAYEVKVDSSLFLGRNHQDKIILCNRHTNPAFTKDGAEEVVKQARELGFNPKVQPHKPSSEARFWIRNTRSYGIDTANLSGFTVRCGSPLRSQWADIPDWFKGAAQRIQHDSDVWSGLQDDGEIAWDVIFGCTPRHWFDHAGWAGEGEESQLVAEPYHLGQEDIEDLMEFCRKYDFRFEISGKSQHYPSSTVRIAISPRVVHPFTKHETPLEHIAHVRAFQTKNRLIAADILEHFLHLVPANDQQFFRTAISVVRDFVNGNSIFDVRHAIHQFHKRAEKKLDILNGREGAGVAQHSLMLSALVDLTKGEEPLIEMEQFGLVRVHCLDAVEYGDRNHLGEARKWVQKKLEARTEAA